MMNFFEKVLSFIFEAECEFCKEPCKNYICSHCMQKLLDGKNKTPQIEYHKNNSVEHCYLFGYEGMIREKILQYKFYNRPYLAHMFFEFFVKNEKVCGFLKKYDIIIAVPMSKKKIAQRGYNQSELIAKKLAKQYNILFLKQVLIKNKENKVQSSLSKKERFENVKNVYKVQNEQKIKEKNILLFDDIYTTGATSLECVKALKQAGATKVGILTIAKDFQKVS